MHTPVMHTLRERLRLRTGNPIAATISLLAALAACVIGVRNGTFAASDTDPYGYVGQAEMLASGQLRIDQRFTLTMPWRDADLSFVPPGFTRGTEPGYIVPTYPAGLPAVMALAKRLTGQRDAVYYVVPLLGFVMVLATARIGARLHSHWLGAVAAVLLVASPIFLLQVTQPVSDVPAAAWWTLSLLLTLRETGRASLGAGLAASMAILTRPNLVPLAAVIAGYYFWRLWRADASERRGALARLVVFCAAVVPGCLTVAALHTYWYGSPLKSGYAPLSELYQLRHVPFNLNRYPRWMVQTQTPLILLGFAAPLVARRNAAVWLLFVFMALAIASYIPYGYFDHWGYLRFFLPGYAGLIVCGLIVADRLLRRALPHPSVFKMAAAACVVVLSVWQVRTGWHYGVTMLHEAEQRYAYVGQYTGRAMPAESFFLAALHSGSIRYYTGQPTINFNNLHPRALEACIQALVAMGRRPFIVIEDGEEEGFRERFGAHSPLGKLDWPPAVETRRGGIVRIYDPAERLRSLSGG